MAQWLERYPALDIDAAAAERISPILFVTGDAPPTLLVHGTQDKVVPFADSELLQAEMAKNKVTHDLVVIEDGDHGFRNPAHFAQAIGAMVKWFQQHLQ